MARVVIITNFVNSLVSDTLDPPFPYLLLLQHLSPETITSPQRTTTYFQTPSLMPQTATTHTSKHLVVLLAFTFASSLVLALLPLIEYIISLQHSLVWLWFAIVLWWVQKNMFPR